MINYVVRQDEKTLTVCTGSRYMTDNAEDLRRRGFQIDPIPQTKSPCPARAGHTHYTYKRIEVPDYAWKDQMRAMLAWEGREHVGLEKKS